MSNAPAPATRTRVRTREQLLLVLNDDPRSVSREEIKAAFADGRLGDQDLDIPVLAGMRRITELLAELHPDDAVAESGASPGQATAAAPRSAGMSVRVTELEERVVHLETAAALPMPPSPTVQEVADLRAVVARLEAGQVESASRVRLLTMLVVLSLVAATVAVALAVLVH